MSMNGFSETPENTDIQVHVNDKTCLAIAGYSARLIYRGVENIRFTFLILKY